MTWPTVLGSCPTTQMMLAFYPSYHEATLTLHHNPLGWPLPCPSPFVAVCIKRGKGRA